MNPPEYFPEILGERMQRGVARDDAARVGPLSGLRREAGAHRIFCDVETGARKDAAFALLVAQHVVVRLMLPAGRSEVRLELRA